MGLYIIAIKDKYKQVVLLSAEGELYCKDVAGLMPYTEPDLDAVRNEAYEKGVQDTKQHWVDAPRTCAYKLGYENGLNDAWEAARKISSMDSVTRDEIFGLVITSNIFDENTASEAIEKIRQYEQRQEEQIRVGDEVIAPMGVAVITEITDERCCFVHADGSLGFDYKRDAPRKTGRHFPEVAEVLQKMKENVNG